MPLKLWCAMGMTWIDRIIITLKWDRMIITLKCHKPVVCDLKIKWHSFLTKITKIAIILFNLTVNSVFFRSGLSKVHFFSKFHFSDIKGNVKLNMCAWKKNIQIVFGTEYQIHVHTPPHTPHTYPSTPHTTRSHRHLHHLHTHNRIWSKTRHYSTYC